MGAIELTEEEFARLFARRPTVRKAANGQPCCPYCGEPMSPAMLDYWNSSTEAGTPNCGIEIKCDLCGRVAWRGGSWWPDIESASELYQVVDEVLDDQGITEE